jgi:hypothetical protein
MTELGKRAANWLNVMSDGVEEGPSAKGLDVAVSGMLTLLAVSSVIVFC